MRITREVKKEVIIDFRLEKHDPDYDNYIRKLRVVGNKDYGYEITIASLVICMNTEQYKFLQEEMEEQKKREERESISSKE